MPLRFHSLARSLSGLLAVSVLSARAAAEEGIRVRPTLAVSQVYDDNIFSARGVRMEDDVWRLSPRLALGRGPGRFTILARAGVDAEIYRRHPELNTATARREADLHLGWTPSKRFAAAATASYAQVAMAGELNTLVGLSVGRAPARRLATTAALTWQLGTRTEVAADHAFARDQVERLPDSVSQKATLSLARQVRPTDQARMAYTAKRFAFGGETTLSHVVTLGWNRDVAALTRLELAAGPSVSGTAVAAEVSATLRRRFRRAEATLGYLRTQTTVVGRPGPVTAEGVAATVSRRLFRSVQVAAAPSVFRVIGEGSETTVRQLGLEVRWRISRRLAIVLAHAYAFQRGGLYVSRDPGLDTGDVVRNTLALRIAAGSESQ